MFALAVYFERRSDCGRQHKTEHWHNLARAFAVDHVFVIDRVNLPCFAPKFESFDVVQHLDDIEFDGQRIFVDNVHPPNRENFLLKDFVHPEDDVLYIFGGDAIGIQDINAGKETHQEGIWLQIETATKHGIWSEQAASIVLSDRYVKNANN